MAGIRIFLGVSIILFAASPELFAAEGEKEPTIVGWRGNWVGRFPDANPPVKWGKVSKLMTGLRNQAEKPKDDKPAGVPAHEGSLTQWLVLGPLPSVGGDKAIDEEFIKDEANWQPIEGEKVKGAVWKKFVSAGSVVDFMPMFVNDLPDKGSVDWLSTPYLTKPHAAYCHTWLYSETGGVVKFSFKTEQKAKVYLNGTLIHPRDKKSKRTPTILKKGWNRVLCKVTNKVMPEKVLKYKTKLHGYPSAWFVDLGLRAVSPYETEPQNIAWATRMPNWSTSGPVIVGDKVFALSEPGDLVCVNKKDGKILWIRSITFFDAVGEKEKKDNPAFQEVAALVKELEEFNAEYVKSKGLPKKKLAERAKLYKKIIGNMRKIDKDRFYRKTDGGNNCIATPVSDGKHIYVWLRNGIAVCYDLDGNRKWGNRTSTTQVHEHGYNASPNLIDGKLIVFMHDLVAFDAQTGQIAWRADYEKISVSKSASPIAFRIKKKAFIYACPGLVRVSDGKVMWGIGKKRTSWYFRNYYGSPILNDGVLYGASGHTIVKAKVPTSLDSVSLVMKGKVDVGLKGRGLAVWLNRFVASLLYHDGLLYGVDEQGNLYVADVKTDKLVYRQELGMGREMPSRVYGPLGLVYASPILAGKHIYVFGKSGTTVVFKPGRRYQEVARNKMEGLSFPGRWNEMLEGFTATPVADGNRLYMRGDVYLYCIGKERE